MKVKLLLTFALLLTAVTGAWADDDSGSCGTVSYSYVESTHTLTISGTGAMADYENPSERPWNSYVEEIETVIIEDGVTRIGNYAFNYCTSLTSVTIPASVTSIGDYAFYDCSGLTSVTIPASVTTIGDAAFFNCSGLTAVTIPSSVTTIGVEAFSYCSNIATMTVEDGNTKYDSRNGCNAIIEQESNTLIAGCKNTIIPDDVTNIDNNAFEGCSGLTTITIPASVKSIGSYAFEGCSGLTTITIPASVTNIGYAAFAGCSNLATMTVDAGNTKYDSRNGCNAIIEKETKTLIAGCKNTKIPDDVTRIGDVAFRGCSGLTTVTIPAGVTYIGSDAFYACTNVEIVYCNANPEELTWDESGCDDFKPDGTTIIHVADADPWYTKFGGEVHGIFSDTPYVPLTWNYDAGTKTLTFSGTMIPSYNDPDKRPWKDYVKVVEKIVISDDVTSIGDDAFGYCASLTTVTIPASVKSIGSYAFENCYSLTTVTIPASVTSIGVNAFYYCESLTSVIVHAPNCALGDYAFDECDNLEAIYVPSDKVEYYKAAENWSTYADKITAFIGGDCGAEGHETDVTWLLKGTSPNYTLTISGTGAMADYDAPSGQPWKDYRSSITSVVIESGVTSIGKNAFNNCTGLTSATVDAPDCTLGNGAFEGCSNLKAIYVPSDLVDHYKTAWSAYASIIMEKIISQGYCGAEGHETDVTWVLKGTSHNYTLTISGTGAMANYNNPSERPWYSYAKGIETIVIEDGVTSIGSSAFEACSDLTTVTIPASVTTIGKYAFYDCSDLTTVTIPAGVTSIGVDAFFNCSGLTTVTIPASVKRIGVGAFNYCSNIATMTVEAGNKVYDSRNGCNAIIEKESNTLIAGCNNTIIPDDVTHIGDQAFEGCIGLMTVTIPAGVTYIGKDAFYNCTAVTDVYCNADPTKLTWDEGQCDDFKEDGSTIIHVADADPWNAKFGCVVNGIFRDSSPIKTVDWEYNSTTKTLTFSGTGLIPSYYDPSARPWNDYVEEVENIVIEEGVKGIGSSAFKGCENLTTVTIPASVMNIGKGAFDNCSGLTTITFPASMRTIGNYAFGSCTGLTSVTFPSSVESIDDQAFYGCSGLTTVTIGSGVTYIGMDAFYQCTAVTDVYCYADPLKLKWEDGGCDDFMEGKTTECHVTDATKFEEKWSTGDSEVNVNVTFVGDLAPQAKTKAAGEEYWSSYYNSATHLRADDNTTVYKATLSGTTVTLTEITDKVITAGQAVLLKKTTTDPVELTPCAAASKDDYSGNDLEGVDAETAKESGSDYYVLSYKDSKLSFYKYSGTTLGANKAFFKIPANSSREFLDILGEVTGIDGRYKMEDGRSDVYYDLNGRRVMNPTKKGVYINNGRKVVIK